MTHRRPPRLQSFDYLGCHRYFVTCCTLDRHRAFIDRRVIDELTSEILQCCERRDFAIFAYVFMPDHLHLLVQGNSDQADFRALLRITRKRTTLAYKLLTRRILWREGYFERVLRRDEDTATVIDYILANPIRAGLVERAVDYPYSWAITLE